MIWPFTDRKAQKAKIVDLEQQVSAARNDRYSKLFALEKAATDSPLLDMVRRSLVLMEPKKNDPPRS